jgi:hypothetical protein
MRSLLSLAAEACTRLDVELNPITRIRNELSPIQRLVGTLVGLNSKRL